MKFGLAQNIIDKLIAVFEQNSKVDKALVFGSRAKGNYRPVSDIDIAIKGQDLNTDDIIAMSVVFEEKGIAHKIDLINYHMVKEPDLKENIDRVGIELYSKWKECELGDVINLKRGYDLPNGDRIKGEIPVISSSGITDYHNVIMKNGPGVITGRYGTIGKVFYTDSPYWPLNTTLYVQDFKNNNPKFIFYFLKGLDFEKYSDKSAVPGVNRNEVHKEKVLLPPIQEQTAIAAILTSLDDKIDLLHRQNKTLEQLAETLFRQWFVEEAEESWEVGTVLDLFKLQRGFDLPTQNRREGKYPIVASSGINETHNEFKVKAPGVTTGRSGSLGDVFYIEQDFWPLNTSLYVSEFKRGTPLFTFFFLKTLDLQSLNGGSAVPTLNRNNVHELKTDLPPKKLIEKFEINAKIIFQKIKSNQTQIRTLTQTRDTLLPKLMSGEVRVNL